MEILMSVLGAASAILLAIIGAVLSNKNSNKLQIRKLKEEYYISYIEALHSLAAKNNDREAVSKYTYHRDKLLIVAAKKLYTTYSSMKMRQLGKQVNFTTSI